MEDKMLKQIALRTALAAFTIMGASAVRSAEALQLIAPAQPVALAATNHAAIQSGSTSRQDAGRPSQALLSEIVTWLSTNGDLPAIHDHPRIEFASPRKLAAMRYKNILPEQWNEDSERDPAMQAAQAHNVVAVYNDRARTIFLPDAWTGATPAELSVLVHEMVHHLQNLAGLTYECPAAREKPAYLAQDQWLKLHGLDLETGFEIDRFTLVVSSACLR
jgi:hypothetical protein